MRSPRARLRRRTQRDRPRRPEVRGTVTDGLHGLCGAALAFGAPASASAGVANPGLEGACVRVVPTVLGLLPPRVDVLEDAEYPQSPAHITAALDSLSPGERATLNSLVRTGGDYFSPAPGDHSRASTLAALESAGLIRGVDKHRAHVPRAVADALAGRTHRNIPLSDPLGRPRDAKPGDKPSATKCTHNISKSIW